MKPAQEHFAAENYLAGRFGASDLGELSASRAPPFAQALPRAWANESNVEIGE